MSQNEGEQVVKPRKPLRCQRPLSEFQLSCSKRLSNTYKRLCGPISVDGSKRSAHAGNLAVLIVACTRGCHRSDLCGRVQKPRMRCVMIASWDSPRLIWPSHSGHARELPQVRAPAMGTPFILADKTWLVRVNLRQVRETFSMFPVALSSLPFRVPRRAPSKPRLCIAPSPNWYPISLISKTIGYNRQP
ncbi:hypothetical protein GA0061099_101535 [Bradyrhizobium yuanmingense]|uniref:Uncharacterized protein n=1 Tax=Bradyrhizobium yuanmingense TaxID=108015 RepID=A0A1C3XFU9_9BRAD|nr:hypothetical protein IQ15_06927 [Bradyrhizobium yuanmingense]SCB51152.1 hypothetical protein GA0061099_101535 [Bradyrhizobium yuanmingense]